MQVGRIVASALSRIAFTSRTSCRTQTVSPKPAVVSESGPGVAQVVSHPNAEMPYWNTKPGATVSHYFFSSCARKNRITTPQALSATSGFSRARRNPCPTPG